MKTADSTRRVSAERAAHMIKALVDGACSRAQLAEKMGMQPVTVGAWITALRSQGLVALCDWAPDSRGYPTIELFRFAPGEPDAVKQVRSRAEQMRDWRAAKKGEVVA